MEYLIFTLAMAAFVLIIFVSEAVRVRKEEKKFINSLYEDHGSLNRKDYALERFAKIGSFFERHGRDGQLDDITWNDLEMDELFKRMNYTLSASGEEYLYYTLRTLKQNGDELNHLEDVISFFGEHPDIRVRVQLTARKLGYTGKFSLYDYLDHLDLLGERSNVKNIISDLLFLPMIALLWINFPVGILGIVVLIIFNIMTYFKEKAETDPYITSFAYVMRLMRACAELKKIPVPVCAAEWQEIREAEKRLTGMRRNSFWVVSPFRGNSSGDILAVLSDYIRMIFHVDIIKFNGMLKIVRERIGDVDTMIRIIGYVETAIAVWEFRESLTRKSSDGSGEAECVREASAGKDTVSEKWWCIPEFVSGERFEMTEGYHPLLKSPVKNSISAGRGVLLTGSNASGKSTFLKTVAVNAVLAQTIHTCPAAACRTDFFHVYSSMALRDSMSSGESYYIVEIKALKRILDAADTGRRPVLCFVDEVLRGTNTVERIAASTQILKSLGRSGILCFAATHDIELTELLKDDFDNWHFEEDIRDGDVHFNYRLRAGKATTRNAIKLLELMGYDRKVIQSASARAEHFVKTGVWKTL